MSLSAIIGAVSTLLGGVSGIGQVYTYQRMGVDPDRAPSVFQTGGSLNAWTITDDSMTEVRDTNSENLRTHGLVIRGYFAHNDAGASDQVFRELVQAICDTFRAKYTLNGTCEEASPMQVDTREFITFNAGAIFAHHCRLRLTARERVVVHY